MRRWWEWGAAAWGRAGAREHAHWYVLPTPAPPRSEPATSDAFCGESPNRRSIDSLRRLAMRVAIESRAVDVLQWLIGAEDAAAHTHVPLPMPLS